MTSQNVIEVVISQNGLPIRLTYKQWSHITENHDYMAGCTDELIALKHYPKTVISRKDAIIIIYKELKNDGFVITAFLTSSCEKIIKRGILWQKSIS
jgi:hypothetical protein